MSVELKNSLSFKSAFFFLLGKTGSLLFLQTAMSLSSKLIALLFQDLVVPRFRVCEESGKDRGVVLCLNMF